MFGVTVARRHDSVHPETAKWNRMGGKVFTQSFTEFCAFAQIGLMGFLRLQWKDWVFV